MAFKMNKPVIRGTTKHSALLAKAEEVVDPRTHGVDPTLGAAAMAYGESNSPNVIDYNIKTRKIKWDKKNQPKRGPKKPNKFNDWLKERVKKARTNIIDKINLLKGDADDGTGENGTNGNGTGGNGTGTVIIDGDGIDITNETLDRDNTEITPIPTILPGGEVSTEDIQQPGQTPGYDPSPSEPDIEAMPSLQPKNIEVPIQPIPAGKLPKKKKTIGDVLAKDTDPNAIMAEDNPNYKQQKQASLNTEGGTLDPGSTGLGPNYKTSDKRTIEGSDYSWETRKDPNTGKIIYDGYIYKGSYPVDRNEVPMTDRIQIQTTFDLGKDIFGNPKIKKPSHIKKDGKTIKTRTRKVVSEKKTETTKKTTEQKTDYSNQSLNDLAEERDKKRENNENITEIQVEINKRLEDEDVDWNKKSEEKKVVEKKTTKKAIRRPREHEYKWGTTLNPGGWKSGGKEAYKKALTEYNKIKNQ